MECYYEYIISEKKRAPHDENDGSLPSRQLFCPAYPWCGLRRIGRHLGVAREKSKPGSLYKDKDPGFLLINRELRTEYLAVGAPSAKGWF